MSWVTAVLRSDDVFDEDVDELSLQNKEWRCNMEKRIKDGFRNGIDAGKEASFQQGFNLGYREGAVKLKTIGQFRGIISALQYWCRSQPSVSSEPITHLLQKVEKHEEVIFEALPKAQEMPPPNVSELVGDMNELGVDHSDCGGSDCCRNDESSVCCQKSQSDSFGQSDIYDGSEILFVKGDGLEQLLDRCMELMTEMGLPEELRLHVQQLRDTFV